MIGVAEDDAGAGGAQVVGRQALHGGLGTDRHEHRGGKGAVAGGQLTAAGGGRAVARGHAKAEGHTRLCQAASSCSSRSAESPARHWWSSGRVSAQRNVASTVSYTGRKVSPASTARDTSMQ